MLKKIFITLTLLLYALLFSQKIVHEDKNGETNYKIQVKIDNTSPKLKEIYSITQSINDSIISEVIVDKYYKSDYEEYTSELKILPEAYAIVAQKNSNGSKMYGITYVFKDQKGKLFKSMRADNMSGTEPTLGDYPAQYPGGEMALKRFFQNNFDNSLIKFTEITKLNIRVRFVVGTDGIARVEEIMGQHTPKIRNEVERLMGRMQKWIPAKSKGELVKSQFTQPITIISEM